MCCSPVTGSGDQVWRACKVKFEVQFLMSGGFVRLHQKIINTHINTRNIQKSMCFHEHVWEFLTFTIKVRVPFSFWGMTILCTENTKRASFETPRKRKMKTWVKSVQKSEKWKVQSMALSGAGLSWPGGSWKGTVRPSWGPAPSGRCSLELRESSTLNSIDFRKLSLLFSKMTDTTTLLSSWWLPWMSYT